jgi:hypothetical protein
MSTLSVGTIKSGTASTPPTIQDSNGTEIGTFCRAWVNFDGTGTVAIRASFNVSSITDHSVGDYTVNFTTALADANYCYVVSSGQGNVLMTGNQGGAVPTTSALRVITLVGNTGGAIDTARLNVTIFR